MKSDKRRFLSIAVFLNRRSKASREQVSGIYRYASEHELWDLHIISRPNSKDDMKGVLSALRPDGIIAGSSEIVSAFRQRLRTRIPAVVLDCYARSNSAADGLVLCADHDVGKTAAEFFISKGFRHFAFAGICGKDNEFTSFNSQNRENGFRRALAKSGFTLSVYNESLLPGSQNYTDLKGLGEWLTALPKPCAILATSDTVAQSVIGVCRRRRISVPLQVAVMGVDNNTSICENTSPTLTSIAFDFEDCGYKAARLLDRFIGSNGESHRSIVRVTYGLSGLVERLSTSNTAGNRARVAHALEIIRRRALEGITAREVADAVGVSPRALEIAFHNASRRTVRDELLDVKLAAAKHLLKTTRLRADKIAERSGFKTGSALKAIFAKRVGKSMRQWRNDAVRHS